MTAVRITVDWRELEKFNAVQPCLNAWVSDDSIAEALERQTFDDLTKPHHESTHRANRIASIVRLMEAGDAFDPLTIALTPDGIFVHDGHHRLRAYQYRRRLDQVPVSIIL